MAFLAGGVPLFVVAPGGSFDPFAAGQYTFALRTTGDGSPGQVAINVNVSAVPLPAALLLFGAGLAGMGLLGWRRKRRAAVSA